MVLLSGCASTTSIDDAKATLEELLPWPQFTEYRGIQKFPGDVFCGEFESPDINFRSVTGWRSFIVVAGKMGPSNSKEAVTIYCSEDPALSLFETLGISLTETTNKNLTKIQRDLSNLSLVIEEYQRLNKLYPLKEDGLDILTRDGTVRGLLEDIPEDPWGRPYNYSSIQWGGSATAEYKLWTYGKDNSEGGKGENADISYKYLPYLSHVRSLLETP